MRRNPRLEKPPKKGSTKSRPLRLAKQDPERSELTSRRARGVAQQRTAVRAERRPAVAGRAERTAKRSCGGKRLRHAKQAEPRARVCGHAVASKHASQRRQAGGVSGAKSAKGSECRTLCNSVSSRRTLACRCDLRAEAKWAEGRCGGTRGGPIPLNRPASACEERSFRTK